MPSILPSSLLPASCGRVGVRSTASKQPPPFQEARAQHRCFCQSRDIGRASGTKARVRYIPALHLCLHGAALAIANVTSATSAFCPILSMPCLVQQRLGQEGRGENSAAFGPEGGLASPPRRRGRSHGSHNHPQHLDWHRCSEAGLGATWRPL